MPARELEQLRLLMNRLPDGILTIDSDLTVRYANVAARRMLHPGHIVVGQPLPDVWESFSLRRFAADLFDPRALTRTEEIPLADDRTLWLVGVPGRDAAPTALLIQDVSVRERRDRSQREFVANAAHELLTPLTGIAGAAHVLEAGAKDDPEIRDRFLAHIARECDRLARIARALLVLARATSGEELPRPELVELKPLLEDAIEGAGGFDNVELHCSAELTVFVDRDVAEQAFTNLVANARRYSGDDGWVLISTDESDRQIVGVDIVDSGPGILHEEQLLIRRRFARGGDGDGSGFGLGLSIAAQALEVVGGTLDLSSHRDTGSLVRVGLPTGRVDVR